MVIAGSRRAVILGSTRLYLDETTLRELERARVLSVDCNRKRGFPLLAERMRLVVQHKRSRSFGNATEEFLPTLLLLPSSLSILIARKERFSQRFWKFFKLYDEESTEDRAVNNSFFPDE